LEKEKRLMMKDINGKKIHIGDIVLFSYFKCVGLMRGKVKDIDSATDNVIIDTGEIDILGNEDFIDRKSNQVAVIRTIENNN
jgi:hypothetical protein